MPRSAARADPARGWGQLKQYRVTVDTSLLASNDAKAIEKQMQEMAADRWELKGVTSTTENETLTGTVTKIYLFWEREAAS